MSFLDLPEGLPITEEDWKQTPPSVRDTRGAGRHFWNPPGWCRYPPKLCMCGHHEFTNHKPYYTHQHIELPEIEMQITHFVLQEGECTACGRIGKGVAPEGFQVGYGPRLTGLIGELSGSQRGSRGAVKAFCQSVLRIPISCGGIQRCVDRVSQAILPYYEAMKAKARSCCQSEFRGRDLLVSAWRLGLAVGDGQRHGGFFQRQGQPLQSGF